MDTSIQTTKLATSFSGLLAAVYSGRETARSIADAIFYFGCTRYHVFTNAVGGEEGEMSVEYSRDPYGVEAAYLIVRRAVEAAEEEGRVAWRNFGERGSWQQLNAMLASHGLPVIVVMCPSCREEYNTSELRNVVRDDNLPYDLIG